MQMPFAFTIPQVAWNPPKISELPSWRDAKRICIDVETKDPHLRKFPGTTNGLGPGTYRPGCHVVGIGFAIEDGPSHYLPIRHEGGDNLELEHVLSYVRDNACGFRGTITGSNLGYDLGFLERDEITFPQVEWFRDIQNADVLINELHLKYGLDAIAERRGLPGKDKTVLTAFAQAFGVDPVGELYKLPGRAAEAYVTQDIRLPLTILRRQEKDIEEQEIQQIWDLESRVLPVIVKMRRRGVRVNLEKVQRIAAWSEKHEAEQLEKVYHLTGVRVAVGDVWKPEPLARALEAVGFKVPLTAPDKRGNRKPSVDKVVLGQTGEVGKAIKRAREYNKLRTTFCKRVMQYQVNGRVHCTFHQLRNTKEGDKESDEESKGARYGRFSSEHYNIQQEPARDDEFGEMWRSIYEPEPGCFWVCSDWSQQEPRIAVHYAELLGLPGAHQFANQYRQNPRTDCHQMLADMTHIARKIVKNYFNGRIYGMGDAKLCRSIGQPTRWVNRNGKSIEVPGPEGQAVIDQFKAALPWVSMLVYEASRQAGRVGHVWTVLRRKCHFPLAPGGGYDWTHKAFSRIGQGSAADQMKATLVEADKAGIPVQLAVHDEFDWSEHDIKNVKLMKELQMNTVKFNVPMLVDSEVGPNWGQLQKLDAGENFVNAMRAFHA